MSCFDCGADLSKRIDWEPFILGVGESMRRVLARYRGAVLPEATCEHVAICASCLAAIAAINVADFHSLSH